jgi:hypothetical protein
MDPSGALPNDGMCPPHHWLIQGEEAAQHWTCRRCGAEPDYQAPPDEADRDPWRGFAGGSKRPPPAFGR